MRILNDEEIDQLEDGYWESTGGNNAQAAGYSDGIKKGCKAQYNQDIKDFIEWGEKTCDVKWHHTQGNFIQPPKLRRYCEYCWQSLKQLVEG